MHHPPSIVTDPISIRRPRLPPSQSLPGNAPLAGKHRPSLSCLLSCHPSTNSRCTVGTTRTFLVFHSAHSSHPCSFSAPRSRLQGKRQPRRRDVSLRLVQHELLRVHSSISSNAIGHPNPTSSAPSNWNFSQTFPRVMDCALSLPWVLQMVYISVARPHCSLL